MTRYRALGIAGAAVAATVVAAGCARCHFTHRTWSHDPARVEKRVDDHLNHLFGHVDATPEQRTRIRAVVDSVVGQAAALHPGIERTRAALAEELLSDTPDTARMDRIVDQEIDSVRTVAHSFVRAAAEIHATLTPEQRQKLAADWKKHRGK